MTELAGAFRSTTDGGTGALGVVKCSRSCRNIESVSDKCFRTHRGAGNCPGTAGRFIPAVTLQNCSPIFFLRYLSLESFVTVMGQAFPFLEFMQSFNMAGEPVFDDDDHRVTFPVRQNGHAAPFSNKWQNV